MAGGDRRAGSGGRHRGSAPGSRLRAGRGAGPGTLLRPDVPPRRRPGRWVAPTRSGPRSPNPPRRRPGGGWHRRGQGRAPATHLATGRGSAGARYPPRTSGP
ncbi:hypothetical protein FTX61_07275 [Nitriliruptoraceae bacterium ZYF776]|nr:hypothetical protein [Profundirhabdus halotolerans]